MTEQHNIESNHNSFNNLKIIRIFGLTLFITGLVIFTFTIFIGNYQITDDVLERAKAKVPADRLEKLTPLKDQIFSSKFVMLDEIEKYINDDNTVQPYQLGEYKFWLLKESTSGFLRDNTPLFLLLTIVMGSVGALIFFLPGLKQLPGIKNNHIFNSSTMNRGLIGIIIGIYLIGFYILLYWYPEYIVNMIILTDPVSQFLRNQPADRWFLYGLLYTFVIIVMGIRMFIKYRHSNYHLVRTTSIIFFQFGFAFMIPTLLERMNRPSMDFKNAWPLNYSFFTDWNLNSLTNSGNLGMFMLFWGIILAAIVVPLMTYFFGKRWYCSWVCGCGGLAETLGDPFRHLSNKSVKSWRIERWMIHTVLVFAVVMTFMQIVNYVSDGSLFGNYTWRVNQAYTFLIGSVFAGVIGTGFYPLMGNRMWCRFGCPLAAILGMVQKFKSRFVITTNGGQCISCGNCSTYCEMGIDVRWYAQRGQNIIRSSCVGCGICASVCPRGVLKLENTDPNKRYNVTLDDEMLAVSK
ncbi:4Fe-4S binding protein [candidate division KSB1 bacterium]|nr:4Fe-4S binding protein [candidate division KSB1 bacterium]